MVKLHELAVRFLTLLLAQHESVLALGRHPRLPLKILKVGVLPVGLRAVRAALRLQLQDAQIDAHLDDLPAAGASRLHEPRLNHAGLELPAFQDEIDVLFHYARLSSKDRHLPILSYLAASRLRKPVGRTESGCFRGGGALPASL